MTNSAEPADTQAEPADTQELRDRAIKRLKHKREFRGNVATFVLINGFLWLIWVLSGAHTNGDGVPWPAWVTGVWALIIVLQGWRLYGEHPISESEIQSEMNQLHKS